VPTKHVILAHGIFRLDALRVLLRDHGGIDIGPHYFVGIKAFLEQRGFIVRETDVSFAGSLATRASNFHDQFDGFLRDTGAQSVHVIGHSMGGLDARLAMAEHPEMAPKVACLTTIGTPHLGTTSADKLLTLGGRLAIEGLRRLINLEGFNDLTTTKCQALNERLRDQEAKNGVRYRTVAADEELPRVTPLLTATALDLGRAGPNDGIVPTSSQAWVPSIVSSDGVAKGVEQISFPMRADHLNEVGIWDTGEIGRITKSELERRVQEFYLQLAETA
jgi:triacylglycerol lipase